MLCTPHKPCQLAQKAPETEKLQDLPPGTLVFIHPFTTARPSLTHTVLSHDKQAVGCQGVAGVQVGKQAGRHSFFAAAALEMVSSAEL